MQTLNAFVEQKKLVINIFLGNFMCFKLMFFFGGGFPTFIFSQIGSEGGCRAFFPRGSAGISHRNSSNPTGNFDQNLNN